MICLEDKNSISQGRSYHGHSNTYSHSYYNVILCSLCYYDATVEGKNLLRSGMGMQRKMILLVPIFMLAFPIFFFIMFSNMSGTDDSPFFDMLGFFFVPIIIFVAIAVVMMKGSGSMMNRMSDQNIERATIAKERLMSSMDTGAAKNFLNKELTCFNCGDVIDINSLFCMNCGDSTKEERAQAGIN
ncbi:MAG: hypothetical protein ACXAC2_14315 [Candidatus Kariarchaeaceae archaeon]|jgi:hypothetical protein